MIDCFVFRISRHQPDNYVRYLLDSMYGTSILTSLDHCRAAYLEVQQRFLLLPFRILGSSLSASSPTSMQPRSLTQDCGRT